MRRTQWTLFKLEVQAHAQAHPHGTEIFEDK